MYSTRSHSRIRQTLAAFLFSTCAIAQTAYAQSTDGSTGNAADTPSSETGIRDIVVTARKRAENIQDTPLAISAISSKTLEEAQLKTVGDLDKAVPSLVTFQSGNLVGTPIFALRGLSTSDYIPTNENPVALYVDGVYVARQQGALFGLEDLQRVEVLRGPQGTLNGRNATAGSISLYTRNPEPDFSISQKFSYGTFQNFVSATTVNLGKLGETGLSVRASYYHNDRNGYVHNLATTDKSLWPGALKEDAIFAAVRGQWGNLTVDYKFDYDKKVGLGPGYQIQTLSATYAAFLNTYNPGVQFIRPAFDSEWNFKVLTPSRDKGEGHSLNMVLDISPQLTLKSITGLRKINTSYESVFAPLPVGTVGNVATSVSGPYSIQPIQISDIQVVHIHQHQFSQEFQLLGKSDRLSYVLGLYYFRERAREDYGTTGSLFLGVLNATNALWGAARATFIDFSALAISRAAFGQMTYVPPVFDDRIELTAGLRYTADKKNLVQTQPVPGTSVVPIPRDVSRKDHNLSAEGTIKVKWTPEVMTYFRVAQAYKAGGFSPRDTTYSPNGYAPEKVISYELGVKAELLDRHLRINADVYQSNFRNIQINQIFTAAQGCLSSATCSTTVADGKARYRGFEAEVTAVPVSGFELNGSVGYVDPKWQRLLANPSATSNIAGNPGVVFGGLAKWTAAGAAKYTFALPFADLTFRGAVNYHSQRYFTNVVTSTNNAEVLKDPGYTNFSAQIILSGIKVSDASFTLSVYGDNLSNKHPVLQGIDATVASGRSYGPGRTFGISLKGTY